MKIFDHASIFLATYYNSLLEPNISFLFFKKLANWVKFTNIICKVAVTGNLHSQNWWPDLKFGITNFGLQKDNGANL